MGIFNKAKAFRAKAQAFNQKHNVTGKATKTWDTMGRFSGAVSKGFDQYDRNYQKARRKGQI